VDVSGCTTASCVLTPTVVHTFSCTSDSYFPGGSGLPGNQIETGSGAQGSMLDLTDTYFSFTCDIVNDTGRGEIDWIRYNKSTDTVTTQEKWYTVCTGGVPSGCGVWTSSQIAHQGYDMIRMNQHPDANYITVLWQCASYPNSAWEVGCGTAGYGPAYNFLGPISVGDYHQDNGFDVNGVPVWVGTSSATGNDTDYYSMEVVNLTTLSTSGITSKQLQLPCSYVYANGCTAPYLGAKSEHISMTGTWSTTPGYALFSTLSTSGENAAINVDLPLATTLGTDVSSPGVVTVTPASMVNIGVGTQQLVDFGSANIETVTVTAVTGTTFTANFAKTHTSTAPVSNLTAGDTGPYAMENVAIKIDTKAPSGSSAQIWRLGRNMSIRDGDYGAEPHTFVNRNWTAYVWGSNWNTDGGTDNGYYTSLSGAGSFPSGDLVSMIAAPNPATVGEQVTLTATVDQTGSAVPTGTINFLNGSASLGSASVGSSGTAIFTTSALPLGSYSVVASYSGDSNYSANQSSAVTLQVQSPTITALAASPNPVTAGQALTLTATVTSTTTPSGTVNFYNGSTLLGSATLNGSGVGTFSTSSLSAGTYSLTAQYQGSSNFFSSTSSAASVTVNAGAATSTTTGLAASPNPVTAGQSLTLTATVTGSTTPSGTVNFYNGSTLLGSGTLNGSGVGTFSTSSLAAGTYSLTAQYLGNSSFLASTSSTASITVNAATTSTTTSLVASPHSLTAGQTLTLTAAVSGTTTPSGTVDFYNGSTLLGSATLNGSGVGAFSTSSLAAGTYSITAQYLGNSSFQASTSSAASVTVNSAVVATTTGLVASPNPLTAGQTLTLTATVSGTTTPSGTVDFYNGSTLLGAATANSSGVATLTTSSLADGTYSLTAQFLGNASFLTSTSSSVSVTVNAGITSTTTGLVASPNPVAAGQPLTLTATVSASGATVSSGTVNFFNGSTLLGSSTVNSSGVASISTSSLAAGTYSLTAQYSGNASFRSSTSSAAPVTVNGASVATATSLLALPDLLYAGQTLTLEATVSDGGASVPTGTVNFYQGATLLGSATLDSSGVATLFNSSLSAGLYSVTAQYQGVSGFLGSTSPATAVTVTPAKIATSTGLAATPNPLAANQTLTLTATVSGTGASIPNGTVNFFNGSAMLGSATLNSSGVATLSTTSLIVGKYSLTAQYPGNSGFLSSLSPGVSVTVDSASMGSSTSLAASPNPGTVGQSLTLTATVTSAITPTGTVNFYNGSALLGSATLNSPGVATLSTSALAQGTYSMTAEYMGDSGLLTSMSSAVSVTVNAAASGQTSQSFTLNAAASNTSPTTQTVLPGQPAIYTFTVTPTSGTILPAIAFSASGLPAGATATFSPSTIAAGSGATGVTLTVMTPANQSAAAERSGKLGSGMSMVTLGLLLLPFGRSFRRSGKRMIKLCGIVLLLAGAISLTGLTGCSGGLSAGSNAQTYNVTVTATSTGASSSQLTNLMLVVE
jgi:Bacterial Ig-like domain (group 3)